MTGRPEPIHSVFMNRWHMEMFVAIAEAGSLHAAARQLDSTAQGISRALARYEDGVEATLFVRDRRARGAFPTLIGSIAVDQARLILAQMEESDRILVEARDALNVLGPSKW